MNTSRLKTFAPAVRRQLMETVGRRLDYVLTADTPDLRQVATQVATLRKEAERDRAALVERVAYTWFNRLAALRFLDARGWHPFSARVLTPATADETQPGILSLLRTGTLPTELQPYTDLQRLNDLLDGRLPTAIAGADPNGEAYRGLILAACRYYHALMPFLFEAIDDETELLLPDDLLTATSVAEGFRTEITDADCAEVEILGWLYQFYISEKKDQVMARKKAVPSEDIPAVTQLFTPHWIVRYLVENSLGRLWLNSRPHSRLREHMPYYVEDPAGQTPGDSLTVANPEEIKLLDPASGSGHMLTYAFDLLVKIYEEEGHAPSEIPEKILTHNLHGLEICPRAAQLASFALVCKAREHSRSAFRRPVQPQIVCLRDVVLTPEEVKGFSEATGVTFSSDEIAQIHQFRENSETFGSLIQPVLDVSKLAALRAKIGGQVPAGDLLVQNTHRKLCLVLDQAEALTQRYHVVVANPPYMGASNMNGRLKTFVEDRYPDSKEDLFSVFIESAFGQIMDGGYLSMVTMQSWLFLTSFHAFRQKVILPRQIVSCIQIGYNSFPALNSKIAQAVSFVMRSSPASKCAGIFFDLNTAQQSADKGQVFLEKIANGSFYTATNSDFRQIPGSPIAYWVSPRMREIFKCDPIENITISDGQNKTGNNERFLRFHWEVDATRVGRDRKWLFYAKGGGFRRWWGNLHDVVDWSPETRRHYKQDKVARIIPDYLWYKVGVTWGLITSSHPSFRILPADATFDVGGSSIFFKDESDLEYVLALLNSKLASDVLKICNPTLNFQVKNIRDVPLFDGVSRDAIELNSKAAIRLAKSDWDNFETSWDFRDQPLLLPGLKGATLEESWRNWEAQSTAAIRRMQELETENNRLFIAAYELDGELQPEVPEAQITLARADPRKDVAAFLSYAIGCMMGRYSLDQPGLILADAGDTVEHYLAKVDKPLEQLPFRPDEDGIVPVLEGEWFEDDLVARTREFLRVTFGEATLNENLRFIEESLGKSLEKYFLTDFYKDHLQTYKKRPIYWLFQSPKKGFSALVYLHRYTRDTVNTLLNKYLRDYLHKLESRITHLIQIEATSTNPKEKTAARKEADKLQKALKDCREWERDVILPLAQQRLEIDLDDGVKVNYLKFDGAVATIAGLAAKEE